MSDVLSNSEKPLRIVKREIVSSMVFSTDHKLLLGWKDPSKRGTYLSFWHLPGGGVEEGESLLQAHWRELKAETSIDLLAYPTVKPNLIDDVDSGQSPREIDGEVVLCDMHFNVFEVRLPSSSDEVVCKPGEDFIQLRWFDTQMLRDFALTPPLTALLERLGVLPSVKS